MKVAIGTDHNGPALKEEIINKLSDIAEFIDCSPVNDPLDDYPDFAYKVSEMVASKKADLGILICGTGIGMSIAANKVKGIRCAHVTNALEAKLSKMHNNANVMAFGAKNPDAIEMVKTFLETSFSNEERHVRRCEEIIKIENGEYNV